MIWRGERCSSEKQLRELQEYVNSELSKQYKQIDVVNDRTCFLLDTGEILSITCMCGGKFFDLCTEYADNIDDMKKYYTTDGDLYPPDEFDTPDEMLQAMLVEIEG